MSETHSLKIVYCFRAREGEGEKEKRREREESTGEIKLSIQRACHISYFPAVKHGGEAGGLGGV